MCVYINKFKRYSFGEIAQFALFFRDNIFYPNVPWQLLPYYPIRQRPFWKTRSLPGLSIVKREYHLCIIFRRLIARQANNQGRPGFFCPKWPKGPLSENFTFFHFRAAAIIFITYPVILIVLKIPVAR